MTITYEQYRYTNGKHSNEKWNKEIISIARRNKFYMGQIKAIINGDCWGIQNHQIIVCIKTGTKNHKVIGFIIYEPNHLCFHNKERMVNNIMYWCVDDAYRWLGYGKELYERCIKDANDFGIVNCCLSFRKDDEKLTKLYTELGYKYIPKYDGVEQKGEDDHHTKWFKIVISSYKLPVFSMVKTDDDEPQTTLLNLLE